MGEHHWCKLVNIGTYIVPFVKSPKWQDKVQEMWPASVFLEKKDEIVVA